MRVRRRLIIYLQAWSIISFVFYLSVYSVAISKSEQACSGLYPGNGSEFNRCVSLAKGGLVVGMLIVLVFRGVYCCMLVHLYNHIRDPIKDGYRNMHASGNTSSRPAAETNENDQKQSNKQETPRNSNVRLDEWEALVDDATGYTYYHHKPTGHVTWNRPPGLPAAGLYERNPVY